MARIKPAVDFLFSNHGSVCLLGACSPAADEWVKENLPDDVLEFGGGVVIEPRYAGPILEAIVEDGLTVREA